MTAIGGDTLIDSPHSIQRHSKSFSLASRLLGAGARRDAHAIYAWCRRADDAVDLATSPAAARSSLDELFSELASVYQGRAVEDRTLRAFQETVERRAIPQLYPHELLLGMQMDTDGFRYQSQDDLLRYCYRVAGTVGLMMSHILGLTDPKGLKHAAHLGIAMQLTNICRDVREDLRRGRIYLPQDELTRFGVPELTDRAQTSSLLTNGEVSKSTAMALRPVVRQQLAIAERYYSSGDAGLPLLARRSRVAIRAARLIYSRIGEVLARRGYNVLGARAHVGGLAKLLLVLRSLPSLFGPDPVEPMKQLPELTYDELERL